MKPEWEADSAPSVHLKCAREMVRARTVATVTTRTLAMPSRLLTATQEVSDA